MKKVIIILALIITTLPGSSQIHYVSHDIPGDYPTIVSAMDAAGMNDTIIMRPGTYSEFLVVPDKGLTFASMYILEPDTSYIRQTVLDGENRLGLFFMEMLNNPVDIIGLTMIRGAGSKPDYLYLGGIGGAIDCFYCDSLSVKSCHITQCRVVIGGAICCTNTKLFLSNTSIHDNHSYLVGGGLAIPEDTHFDSLNLCSVYNNYSGSLGCDIMMNQYDHDISIHLDTASTELLDPYFIFIQDGSTGLASTTGISYNIQNHTITPISHDLYVAPWGDNSNSGISEDDPFRSITHALKHFTPDSINSYSILLDEGIYSPETTGDIFPLQLQSYMSLIGKGSDKTVFLQDSSVALLRGIGGKKVINLQGFKIQNTIDPDGASIGILIEHTDSFTANDITLSNIIYDVTPGFSLGANKFTSLNEINIINSTGVIGIYDSGARNEHGSKHFYSNIQIRGLSKWPYPNSEGSSALSIGDNGSIFHIINSAFCDISGTNNFFRYPYLGFIYDGRLTLYNCTIGDNHSTSVGGIVLENNANLGIYNSIFYNNDHPSNIVFDYDENYPPEPSTVTIENTLFEGGYAAIEDQHPTPGYNTINYDATNFEDDPLWLNSGAFPYSLKPQSPCVDKGSLSYYDTIPLPEYDLAGNPRVWGETIDLGAYEYQGVHPYAPGSETISCKVYPNPFFHETRIEVPLQYTSEVKIEIFSSNGRRITSPASGTYPSGIFTTYWNGFDKHKNHVPDGLYIVRVSVNGEYKDFKVVKGGE